MSSTPGPINENRHTPEMEAIISTAPSWLIKWGIVVFLAVFIIVLMLAALIRLPIIIKAPLSVRSIGPSLSIASPANGNLLRSMVAEHQRVTAGQVLLLMTKEGSGDTIAVKAPKNGNISMTALLHKGQIINTGDGLFRLTSGALSYYNVLLVPVQFIDVVKKDQIVLVNMEISTTGETTLLKGRIKHVLKTPENGHFLCEVALRESNQKFFLEGRNYEAEIIIGKVSILKKVAGSIFNRRIPKMTD